jgi:spermidine synthase
MARPARRARVLVVGGGDGAIPTTLLEHGAETVAEVVLVDQAGLLTLASEAHALPDDSRFRTQAVGAPAEAAQAIRAAGLFDLVIVDQLPDDPAMGRAILGCLAPTADVAIREAPLLAAKGAYWQGNGHELARVLRDALPTGRLACAAAPTPFQRGGFHAVLLFSVDGHELSAPVREWRGRHYDPAVHRAAMALPPWWPTVDDDRLEAGDESDDARTWWHEDTREAGITQALRMQRTVDAPSPHQSIEVHEHPRFGTVLTLDGTVQLSTADEAIYHEMAAHVPLLSRPFETASVLIIGGGDGGLLREVLRHDFVRRAVMVELDPAVIEVSNRHIGVEGDYGDPRVELVTDDAANWLPEAHRRGELFDVVLIDATDSTGPSSTLWNDRFYGHVAGVLKEGGLCLDSDIAIPSRDGGLRFSRDPCPLGIFDLIRARRPFAATECYYTRSPLYPGGYFAFFLHSQNDRSSASPARELVGRHYTPTVHRAAFALPRWWREILDAL